MAWTIQSPGWFAYNDHMSSMSDVLVIGGGVIGLTAARELARLGLGVTLCDRGEIGQGASMAGAGMIPPGNPAAAAEPPERLRAISAAMYPAFAAELEAEGRASGYRACGGFELLDEHSPLPSHWASQGIDHELIPPSELTARLPWIDPCGLQAWFLRDYAQVDNPLLLKSLAASCEALGVTLMPNCDMIGFERQGARFVSAFGGNGRQYRAGHCVVAAGAWASRLLSRVGCRLEIFPVRGQIVQFREPHQRSMPIIVRDKCYIVPRGDGRVLAGSTEEPEAGFAAVPTEEGVAAVKRFAFTHWPELRQAEVDRTWAGLRPGTHADRPAIGFVPGFDNLLAAVGHFRAGIQLAPATAAIIADLVLNHQGAIDPADFAFAEQGPVPMAETIFAS